MQICITQVDGVRHFSKFKNIPERDKIEVELTIVGNRPKVYIFDLTDVLLARFEEHPEILHQAQKRRSVDYEAPTRTKPIRSKPLVTAKTPQPEPSPAPKPVRSRKTAPIVAKEQSAVKKNSARKPAEGKPAKVTETPKPTARPRKTQAAEPVKAKQVPKKVAAKPVPAPKTSTKKKVEPQAVAVPEKKPAAPRSRARAVVS